MGTLTIHRHYISGKKFKQLFSMKTDAGLYVKKRWWGAIHYTSKLEQASTWKTPQKATRWGKVIGFNVR